VVSFDELVTLAYDAPLSTAGWSSFLRALGDATRSRATAIKWVAYEPRGFHMIADNFGASAMRGYEQRYSALDVWSSIELAGDADLFGDEMLPRAVLERSEFYQDFCRHHELVDIHKVMLGRTPDSQISIALMKDGGAIDRDGERELTRKLAPHLRRSLALARRMAEADDVRGALADALDLHASAAFLLDARGRVRHATPSAEAIARAADGLTVTRRMLRATLDNTELAAYLRGMLGVTSVRVQRPSGAPPYRVVAVPRTTSFDASIAKVVVVSETRAPKVETIEARLRCDFGLTDAEARVAVRVGRGTAPRLVANELGVSWYTVRAQLRQIFAKTGVQRQAQLVELVARAELETHRAR
jgi:DNA-binding CsgD family transcriptional regulator